MNGEYKYLISNSSFYRRQVGRHCFDVPLAPGVLLRYIESTYTTNYFIKKLTKHYIISRFDYDSKAWCEFAKAKNMGDYNPYFRDIDEIDVKLLIL